MKLKIRQGIINCLNTTNWLFGDDVVKIYYKKKIYFLDKTFLTEEKFKIYNRGDFELPVADSSNIDYYHINPFQGLKRLSHSQIWDLNTNICFKKGYNFWYMVDSQSNKLNDVEISSFRDFHKGIYLVNGRIIIDSKGKVLSNEYSSIEYFNHDVTFAKNKYKYNLINTKGNRMNNDEYDTIFPFSHGYAGVGFNTFEYEHQRDWSRDKYDFKSKVFHINLKGERIYKNDYNGVGFFGKNGLAYVMIIEKTFFFFYKRYFNFINTKGELISENWFNAIVIPSLQSEYNLDPFIYGYASVKKGDKWIKINENGQEI